MSDGSISIKLAPDYEMKAVQKAVESYGEDEDLILNDSFFPKISISEFRNVARIDGTITTARLKDALVEAIASVNDELANYKSKQTVATLSAVENAKIGGQNILAYRYKRAVHCLAQANLYERYASYDTNPKLAANEVLEIGTPVMLPTIIDNAKQVKTDTVQLWT